MPINFFNLQLSANNKNSKNWFLFSLVLFIFLSIFISYFQIPQLINFHELQNEFNILEQYIQSQEFTAKAKFKALEKQKLLKIEYDKIKDYNLSLDSLLLLISKIIPVNICLSEINFTDKLELELTGISKSPELLTNFLRALSEQTIWTNVILTKIDFQESKQEFIYTIKLNLCQK